MKLSVDVSFWNDRARQPECLTVIKFNHVGCVILPFDEANQNKLIEQWQKRIDRNAGRI